MAFKKVKPGHRLYEVDLKSGGIAFAEMNPEPIWHKVNEVRQEQLRLRPGVVRFFERDGFVYFSALNIESVRKQFCRFVKRVNHGNK